MSRLPIRARLTAAFAVAMAVVLAATGFLLYVRLQSSLDEAVDETLEARLTDAVALARSGDRGRTTYEEGFVDIGPPAVDIPERLDRVPGVDGPVRTAGQLVETSDGPVAVVAGVSLGDRNEALQGLIAQLLIVAPLALALTALLGYWLARAALTPVEAMRAEAEAISGSEPGRRLSEPEADDEIGRLGRTLNEMLGRLESALRRERAFVADASHELRTPLALLKAELELALSKERSPEELRRAVASAERETDRLVRLAEDLLVLAQADEGKLPLRREQIGAAQLLERVANAFRRRAAQERREITVESSDDFSVEADLLRLEQALGNLVDNALRHGRGRVTLSAEQRVSDVKLQVLDEGAGFDPSFLPDALERFGRQDESRTGGGAGLGLALVAAIAEAHGGHAHVVNRREGGAIVSVILPG